MVRSDSSVCQRQNLHLLHTEYANLHIADIPRAASHIDRICFPFSLYWLCFHSFMVCFRGSVRNIVFSLFEICKYRLSSRSLVLHLHDLCLDTDSSRHFVSPHQDWLPKTASQSSLTARTCSPTDSMSIRTGPAPNASRCCR